MLINEILKMPPISRAPGKDSMVYWAYDDANKKQAKILFHSDNEVIYEMPDHLRYIVLRDNNPIFYLSLHPKFDGYKVGTVSTTPESDGQGLGVKSYLRASDILKKPIYSDSTQTDASRKGIWGKLLKSVPDRMVGFDQTTKTDLPLEMSSGEPIVNKNEPIYHMRKPKDVNRPISPSQRERTRLLKLLPNN